MNIFSRSHPLVRRSRTSFPSPAVKRIPLQLKFTIRQDEYEHTGGRQGSCSGMVEALFPTVILSTASKGENSGGEKESLLNAR